MTRTGSASAGGADAAPVARPARGGGDPLPAAAGVVERARALVPELAAALDRASVELDRARQRYQGIDELALRLSDAETDRENLLERLREREQQMGRLMTLYVTTYQLHCTLDPQEVQSTIVDIVINLLGAESFVLFLRSSDGTHYEPVIVHTTDGLLPPPFDQERYQGGDLLVDAVLAEGSLAFGPVEGSPVLAAVALRVQDVIVGTMVVFRLLAHKDALLNADLELLDVIGSHAASALVASRLYANMARKLRTLEELISLVKVG
jgi:nitrate/nitrite-specific signal transduction histidine kinase